MFNPTIKIPKELLDSLTMYECKNKMRLGNEHDGGYIIMDTAREKYDYLLSGGVGGDIGFEKAFTEKYDVDCMVFDGECNKAEDLCKNENKITFVKKNISNINNANITNMKEYINKYNNVFLKMDIEGHEFPFLAELTYEELNKIKQMTLEFHFPSSPQHWVILNKIAQTHYLIHYHANNNNWLLYPVITEAGHHTVPAVFECTYIRKDCLENPPLNKEALPTNLDNRNTNAKLDYLIDVPPWVHK
jgi:hypothetical protein